MCPEHQVNIGDDAKARQCSAILAALKVGPLSSLAAREGLGILHPAGRVLELRKAGHRIETVRRTAFDAEGRKHACASYELRGAA